MMTVLLIVYVILGPLAWIGLCVVSGFATVRMSRLHAHRATLTEPPTLTVIVPARNEAAAIESCVDHILGQDTKGFELIVVNDRSTDATGEILDELSRTRPRLGVIHVTELPAGWVGKTHALHVATREVTTEWVLFVDSDVTLSQDAVGRSLGLCVHRNYDALSLLPRIDARTFWEKLLLAPMAFCWSSTFAISLTNDDSKKNHAFANGQFFLMRRGWYEKVGNHESVKDQVCEDVWLMLALKRAGATVRFQIGTQLAGVRMYASLKQLYNGWARIFAGTRARNPWPMVGAIVFMLLCVTSIVPAISAAIVAGGLWWAAVAVHAAVLLAYASWMYRSSGQSAAYALLLPMVVPFVIAILSHAIGICRTGKVVWRGGAVDVARSKP